MYHNATLSQHFSHFNLSIQSIFPLISRTQQAFMSFSLSCLRHRSLSELFIQDSARGQPSIVEYFYRGSEPSVTVPFRPWNRTQSGANLPSKSWCWSKVASFSALSRSHPFAPPQVLGYYKSSTSWARVRARRNARKSPSTCKKRWRRSLLVSSLCTASSELLSVVSVCSKKEKLLDFLWIFSQREIQRWAPKCVKLSDIFGD